IFDVGPCPNGWSRRRSKLLAIPGKAQGRCPRPTVVWIAVSRHYRRKNLLGVFKVPERALFNGNASGVAVRRRGLVATESGPLAGRNSARRAGPKLGTKAVAARLDGSGLESAVPVN